MTGAGAMPEARVLSFAEIAEERFERWDITGHQLTRHLLSEALTGTPEVVADFVTFPPGFIHHMHRHPHADQFLVPLSGRVEFHGATGDPVDVGPGQLLLLPRGNWHEVRNVSSEDCRAFHFFTGVGSNEDIGYEAHPDAGRGGPPS